MGLNHVLVKLSAFVLASTAGRPGCHFSFVSPSSFNFFALSPAIVVLGGSTIGVVIAASSPWRRSCCAAICRHPRAARDTMVVMMIWPRINRAGCAPQG